MSSYDTHHIARFGFALFLGALLSSCATLEGLRAIPDLQVDLDRVEQVHLAGVALDDVDSYRDLSAVDALTLVEAIVSGALPLELVAVLEAENPSSSSAPIDLLTFDWTLFLEQKETVSGQYTHREAIQPGSVDTVQLTVGLDLVEFFDGDKKELMELVARAAGLGGREPEVGLLLRPTLVTPWGTVRYPTDIVVGSGTGR